MRLIETWVTPTKYYHAVVNKDLFGRLTLVKTWGGRDSKRGGREICPIESYYAGEKEIEKIAKVREKRGYSEFGKINASC